MASSGHECAAESLPLRAILPLGQSWAGQREQPRVRQGLPHTSGWAQDPVTILPDRTPRGYMEAGELAEAGGTEDHSRTAGPNREAPAATVRLPRKDGQAQEMRVSLAAALPLSSGAARLLAGELCRAGRAGLEG